jgi:hypothetical protein
MTSLDNIPTFADRMKSPLADADLDSVYGANVCLVCTCRNGVADEDIQDEPNRSGGGYAV